MSARPDGIQADLGCRGIGQVLGSGRFVDPPRSRPDHRQVRATPHGRLWHGGRRHYPGLTAGIWYSVYTVSPPDASYVWLKTAHGLTRVHRADVELRGL